MSEHASAIEAAMKAGGFDPLNHIARKSVEDAVAAYLSERGHDVAVKALEWERGTPESTFGINSYSAYPKSGGEYIVRRMYSNSAWVYRDRPFDTEKQAKAAAQADYTARILSAIAAPPAEGGR